ncbi:uncharacterized protein TNCV_491741 [Trichonephila clavipes]|nr:uncharacterized protein TNCV_491741 [Trichonephila clavipes]
MGLSRAAHVMGTVISNIRQPGTFVWFEKTQGPPVKVLRVPGWRPMKQLAERVYFLRCCGLLNDCFVEGVLILVFVQMRSLGSTGPNTSQHNQSGLGDHPASIMPMILPYSNCDSCSYCLRKLRNGMSISSLSL